MNARPPQFLSDFGRDLRDRHLLIPVVALLVALVAVPVLLSSEPVESVPPPPPALSADDISAVQSAVFVDTAGIRNYRKRLEALKKKNPFKQEYPVKVEEPAGAGEAAAETGAEPIVEDIGSTDTGVTADTGDTVTDPAPAPAPAPGDDPSIEDPDDPFVFFEGTVDVVFGPTGDAQEYEGVRPFEVLPNPREGVVSFLGLGLETDNAYFLLSPQVIESDGDGTCSPKAPAPCQFLELAIGEERVIKVADAQSGEVTTYRLKLTGTDLVEIEDPRDARAAAMAATGGS